MEEVLVAVGIGADETPGAAMAEVEVVNGQVQCARPEPLNQQPPGSVYVRNSSSRGAANCLAGLPGKLSVSEVNRLRELVKVDVVVQ